MRVGRLAAVATILLLPVAAPGCSSTECTGPGPPPEVGTRESIKVPVDATGKHTGPIAFAMRSWTFPADRILALHPGSAPVVVHARLIGEQRARLSAPTGSWTQESNGFLVADRVCM